MLTSVAIASLLTHDASTPINELIDDQQPAIPVDTPANEVATQFSDHDWISAPVVDENNILLGRITIDDVVDIIRDQAEHQALSAAGLDEDEDLFSPVWRAMRRRLIWLSINLATAFLAASVVGEFAGTIDKPGTAVCIMAFDTLALAVKTSNVVACRCSGGTPTPVEALPCGSRSIMSTCSPTAASAVPRLIAVVVFPTPPF